MPEGSVLGNWQEGIEGGWRSLGNVFNGEVIGMIASKFSSAKTVERRLSLFARRSLLPLGENYLWQIESGVVRTLTWFEDGTNITLGLWGAGDVVGRALSKAEPYQIECLTPVEATKLPVDEWHQVNKAIISHIQQIQEFLEILHSRSVDASLWRLLTWLANKFGHQVEQGQLIELRLTHQEIAEIVGTTRVTVTRILREFEERGIIERLPRKLIVLREKQPFWHYEI